MHLNELFNKCDANGTDVVCYFKAPYYLWCNCHAPEIIMKMIAKQL